MLVDDSSTDTPSGLLGVRSRMHFTGRLDIRTNGQQWSLYLYMGRLIWAGGGPHPKRRWHRYLSQHSQVNPKTIAHPPPLDNCQQCQDYHTLADLVKRQQITPEQAVSIIRSTVAEVLFDIIQQEETKPVTFKSDAEDVLDTSLALLNAEQLLLEVQQAWNAWRTLGLADHSPNLAPVLRNPEQLQQQTSEKVYKTLISLVDGRRTLRDLAVLMKQDLLQLTRVLVPLYRKGLVGLTKISDLSVAGTARSTTVSGQPASAIPTSAIPASVNVSGFGEPLLRVSPNAPMVACIDDSARECQVMERILSAAGYQFVGIQDSIQALPTLLEKKPGLIFLDLVMPVANGYEICAQIRRISQFKSVPIVILTSNDGIIDRVRAKMVGSSGFLAKPVEADKVLAIAQRYLAVQKSSTFE
ncbi:MAG: response regulator [Leptolyngbyaceae cyanobacterium CSU_1_3]|nr:response regulator [Leptolyngbyaceae cyanobacterium CSU_1_3]